MKKSLKLTIFASLLFIGVCFFPLSNGSAQTNVLLASVEWVSAQINPLKTKVSQLEAKIEAQAREIDKLKNAISNETPILPSSIYVNSLEATVHRGALTSYRVVAVTTFRQKFNVIAEHGDWYNIEYSKGKYGWIQKSKISTSSAVKLPTQVKINKTTTIHRGALTSYQVVATLSHGQSVKFISSFVSQNEVWINVELSSGQRGWIQASSGEVK